MPVLGNEVSEREARNRFTDPKAFLEIQEQLVNAGWLKREDPFMESRPTAQQVQDGYKVTVIHLRGSFDEKADYFKDGVHEDVPSNLKALVYTAVVHKEPGRADRLMWN